jgi:hypothetical protein
MLGRLGSGGPIHLATAFLQFAFYHICDCLDVHHVIGITVYGDDQPVIQRVFAEPFQGVMGDIGPGRLARSLACTLIHHNAYHCHLANRTTNRLNG